VRKQADEASGGWKIVSKKSIFPATQLPMMIIRSTATLPLT